MAIKTVKITIKSKISKRELSKEYTISQLIFMDYDSIVEDVTACGCEPIGETNVVECNCEDEWVDFDFIID